MVGHHERFAFSVSVPVFGPRPGPLHERWCTWCIIVIVLHMTLIKTNVTLRLYLLKLSGNNFGIFAYLGNLFRILPWPIIEYCHIVRSQNQIQFQYSGNQCLAHFHNFRQLQWESNYCSTIFRTQLRELPMAVRENFV